MENGTTKKPNKSDQFVLTLQRFSFQFEESIVASSFLLLDRRQGANFRV
jgi:hypothetical protein